MSQSLAQIYLHIVFSTQDRRPFLKDRPIREKMHGYLKGICKKQNCPWIAVGGTEDHVHIACRLVRYINDQENHHRRESFQDEFRRLLRKYHIDFDERYVWN